MKNKIVILGIDDFPHQRDDLFHYCPDPTQTKGPTIPLIAVTCKGLQLVDIQSVFIEVDGIDGTEKVISLYEKFPFKSEIRLILINAITVGGFNIINPFEIQEKTQVPVLLVSDNKPKFSH